MPTTIPRRRSAGCLVCRLRGKGCTRPPGSFACTDCSRLRLRCHERVGPVPVGLRRHYACEAAHEEIRQAIATATSRTAHHPLPMTESFSRLLEQATLSRFNTRAAQALRYQEASPQCQAELGNASTPPTPPVSSPEAMESNVSSLFPTYSSNSIPDFDPLFECFMDNSAALLDDAPDRIVYHGPLGPSRIAGRSVDGSEGDGHQANSSTPVFLDSHPPPSPQQDVHLIIESLRPFLWYCGYELVHR
ncbi:uncharacterized protein EI90DRAFT_3044211 [Cantharellus anzutake]|uniref:uncharacterized protein n=1 Tax=Cantharellus anzutake TaxID=1750568 RepID=UPI001906701B|nr:uncharacterized protein EI90DRAFT_3044211 [Cantharellus anzutake]KAF8336930.1 hypothetical protein EI90DRAFT_3044211 [Cantharellus anzutake]